MPLSRLYPLAEDYLPVWSRLLDSPPIECRACFHARALRFPRPTFHLEALRGLIFRSGPPPQSSFTSRSCLVSFDPKLAYLGFRPSSRHHRSASTYRRTFPSPTSFRPQAFSASRRFTPRIGLRACFISQPRPGFASVQGLLSPRSLSLPRRKRVPPCRFSTVYSPTEVSCRIRSPRLRGFAPREGALSRELVLPTSRLAPLFGFLSPPGANHHLEFRLPDPLRS